MKINEGDIQHKASPKNLTVTRCVSEADVEAIRELQVAGTAFINGLDALIGAKNSFPCVQMMRFRDALANLPEWMKEEDTK